MSAASIRSGNLLSQFSQLRELLRIVAEVRDLGDPFGSAEQFRRLLAIVVRVGLLCGLDAVRLERWRAILGDEALIAAVLSVVRYVLSRRGAV